MLNLDEKAMKELNISVKNTLVIARSMQLASSKLNKSVFAEYPKKQFPLNLSPLRQPGSNKIKIPVSLEPLPEFMNEYLNIKSSKKHRVKSKLLDYSKSPIRTQRPSKITNPKSEKKIYTSSVRPISNDFYHDLIKNNHNIATYKKNSGRSNSILARYSKSTKKYIKEESCLKISESRGKGDLRLLTKSVKPANPRESLEENYKKLKEIIKDPLIYNTAYSI